MRLSHMHPPHRPSWVEITASIRADRMAEKRRQRTFRQPRPSLPTPTSLARCKPSMPAGFEHDPGRREGGDNPCGRAEPLTLPESSRTNADDRLPRAPLGGVEGGDSFVEGRDVADVRPQP